MPKTENAIPRLSKELAALASDALLLELFGEGQAVAVGHERLFLRLVRVGAIPGEPHHQITGEPMKFLTLADWTGMVETELFAQTYRVTAW